MKKFRCMICGYIHEGDSAPEKCPQCKAPASKFELIDESAALTWAAEHVVGAADGAPAGRRDSGLGIPLPAELPRGQGHSVRNVQ